MNDSDEEEEKTDANVTALLNSRDNKTSLRNNAPDSQAISTNPSPHI